MDTVTIVLTIVGALGTPIGAVGLWIAVRPRVIAFRTSFSQSLLVPRPEAANLEVFIKGVRVWQPHLTVLRISNTGRQAIETRAYEEPVRISLGKDAKILFAVPEESSPSSLTVKLSFNPESVTLQPLLLNKGDWLDIKIWTDGKPSPAKVEARIEGVRRIVEAPDPFGREAILFCGGLISLAIGIYLILSATYPPKKVEELGMVDLTLRYLPVAIGYGFASWNFGSVSKRFPSWLKSRGLWPTNSVS